MAAGPPRILPALAASARLLASRPLPMLALGAGVVLSLTSVCCGVGLVVAPWLTCELMAMQLSERLHRELPRSRAFVLAALVLLSGVMLTASTAWLAWLGMSPVAAGPDPSPAQAMVRLAPAALAAAVCLLYLLPFVYAPLSLIDRGGTLGGAVLESARLAHEGGALRLYLFAGASGLLQLSPALLAGALVALSPPERSALWAAAALPPMALTLPLGQGMLVERYAQRRQELADATRTRLAGRPPRSLSLLWALLVLAPLLSSLMLGASLVRPARLAAGRLASGGETVAILSPLDDVQRVRPRGTALTLRLSPGGAHVEASDGGGAGRLPLASEAPITSARVVRVRDSYGIEVVQEGRAYHTRVDRAGVRLDDDLRTRLSDRVPAWMLAAMLMAVFSIAIALLPVLAALARVRKQYAAAPPERLPPRELTALRSRVIRRATLAAVPLVPLAGLSLYAALHAWLP
ncbi:MAG: hypothetical protein PVI30_02350 [Myxococcales bacterium]|jgi:hypothetical protein